MSLDDLISLLLFVLFIGLPVLSRLVRGTQRPQQQKGKAPPPKTVQRRVQGKTDDRPSTRQPSSAGDDFGKRLEEARRRVREAVEGKDAEAEAGQFQPNEANSMFKPRPEPVTTGLPKSDTPFSRPSSLPTAFLPSESVTARSSYRKPTAPLQVQRSVGLNRAKLSGVRLTFSEEDLMRGIIWKQILDEPRGKRAWRNPSQHP